MNKQFVVIDGPSGSGKSVQTQMLSDAMKRDYQLATKIIYEPGATGLGQVIRSTLLNDVIPACAEAQMLCMLAGTVQSAHEIIIPYLNKHLPVIAHRWISSTIVYQGMVGGLTPERVYQIAQRVMPIRPDYTFVLTGNSKVFWDRMHARDEEIDKRYEGQEYPYFNEICAGFAYLCAMPSLDLFSVIGKVIEIDAVRPPGEIHAEILDYVTGNKKP